MSNSDKKALVLLNMGGPDSLDAIEPFLYNLFADRDLIQLPAGALLQKPFAKMISHFRAKKVEVNYRVIGGKSPLLEWTQKQAAAIAEQLGENYRPYVAMRYWMPRADEVVKKIALDGIRDCVVLSMYPHYTGATTGSSIKDFKRAVARHAPELNCSYIEEWYDWPGYLDALAGRIEAAIDNVHDMLHNELQIVFSAHALPQKFIDRGDPYLDHVKATVDGVMQRVGDYPYHLGFQSRSGPVKWMEPETTEVMDDLAKEGCRTLLMVPISFVSDHIETLHEIDIEYRDHAINAGIHNFYRAPSLNVDPIFITAMADLVRNRTEQR
ncbi:MAG: ferrochelatase [Desulfuromonas sp.]|nr:MAG: ferrochelatase [Desulfuromonas sp.]